MNEPPFILIAQLAAEAKRRKDRKVKATAYDHFPVRASFTLNR